MPSLIASIMLRYRRKHLSFLMKINIPKLMTGIEPVTPSLPRKCSTSEPHQPETMSFQLNQFTIQSVVLSTGKYKIAD